MLDLLHTLRTGTAAAGLAMLLCGCSVQRIAVDRLGDALAAGGTTFASDEDPELVAAAVPFSLKLMESLLAESPGHRGLLTATAAGFTQYAYAFVQQDADFAALDDAERASAGRDRARRLYLRARDYGLRGLDGVETGLSEQLRRDAATAVSRVQSSEVALLYWTAVSWAAAIGLGKDTPALVAELPLVSALIERALALDESWGDGAIHAFLITWEMVRPDATPGREARARSHLERAAELSDGKLAGPWVSWAESFCLPRAELACFEESLRAALAIDPAALPSSRLANTVMQRRAAWLLANADRWILPPLPDTDPDAEDRP